MDLGEKLEILADSAKYDVACTSSGVDRPGRHGSLGSCAAAGICHAFTPDGRCVSLLKVLYSNACSYDCPLLCQPPLQRPSPGHLHAPGTGRPDHRFFTAATTSRGCFCPVRCWVPPTAPWN